MQWIEKHRLEICLGKSVEDINQQLVKLKGKNKKALKSEFKEWLDEKVEVDIEKLTFMDHHDWWWICDQSINHQSTTSRQPIYTKRIPTKTQMVTTPEEYKNKYYGGSQETTEENLDCFIQKLKTHIQTKEKMTFRQWLNRMMTLIDLID